MKEITIEKYYKLKLHFVYCLTIAVSVIAFLLALMFYSSVKAGEMLAFAGTITSIILAVLAIMITLLDVAGQKNSVYEVKTSTEELREISTEIKVMIENFNAQSRVYYENIENSIGSIDGVVKSLTDLKGTDKDADLDVEELVKELNRTKEKLNNISMERSNNYISTQYLIDNKNHILNKRVKDFTIDINKAKNLK